MGLWGDETGIEEYTQFQIRRMQVTTLHGRDTRRLQQYALSQTKSRGMISRLSSSLSFLDSLSSLLISRNHSMNVLEPRRNLSSITIRLFLLPTAVDNAYPFECQCADCSLMSLTLLSLHLVKRFSPKRVFTSLQCPFNKCLSEEFGTTPAPMHP